MVSTFFLCEPEGSAINYRLKIVPLTTHSLRTVMESTRYFLTIDISIIGIWIQASELTSPGWLAQCTGSNCWNSFLSPEADHFKKSQPLTHYQGDKESIGMDEGDPTSATCFAILLVFLLMFYLLVCARCSLSHSLIYLQPLIGIFSQLKVSILYMFKNKKQVYKVSECMGISGDDIVEEGERKCIIMSIVCFFPP